MKMVSAAKLRKAQDTIVRMRPYANKLKELLQRLSAGLEGEISTPYAQQRDVKNVLVVVVTSNKGLAGSFNSSIIKVAVSTIESKYGSYAKSGNLKVLCIGRKAYEYFSKRNYSVLDGNHDVFSHLSFDGVAAVADKIKDGFLYGDWDRVELVYNEFKNIATQNRMAEQYLPIALSAAVKNKTTSKKDTSSTTDYIYEPAKEKIIEELIPQILNIQLYRAVLESNAAEHGARMFAMDNATENAQDLLNALRLSYNKARQAAITKEILEIVGGAEALASK